MAETKLSLCTTMKKNGFPLDVIGSTLDHIHDYYAETCVELVCLDWDCCVAIANTLFSDESSLLQRFRMFDYYHNTCMVRKATELAMNFIDDLNHRTKEFKKNHPFQIVKVIGLCGSYRQDFLIDLGNRSSQNDPLSTGGIDYYKYDDYFKGVIPKGKNGLVCVEGGDLDALFKFLGIEYIPQFYADGDGPVGCCRGKRNMTVDNNRPVKLKNALGEPIKRHDMKKQGLVECHLAKINKRFPNAKIVEMLFYDDKKEYLKSIKETPLRKNEKVKTFHFVGWPDASVSVPKEVFSDVSYEKASAAVGGDC